ncbi:hypothetical protein [Kitasatospora mediocidica]|uniref:hypothetical protein n=1 Tax=Kitasatospora mediocidica TaxID=58352 RepID=UPI000A93652B|nr:hypothetical protein [Kitasatospora mediocidica]
MLGDRVPVTPAVYAPHLNVAYAGDGVERAEKISLVAQWHDGRGLICWENLLDVALGG